MLLIFDLDGTLFQAKPVVLRTAEFFAREIDRPMPDDNFIYKSAKKFLEAILPDGADMRGRYDEILHESVTEIGSLYPGVTKMLKTLHGDGHTLMVCSASSEDYIEQVLRETGIFSYFTAYYSAVNYHDKAECVADILAEAGFYEKAAVIGDTHGDVEAAQENGLFSVAVLYGYGNKKMLSGADSFADTPEGIIDCVRELD